MESLSCGRSEQARSKLTCPRSYGVSLLASITSIIVLRLPTRLTLSTTPTSQLAGHRLPSRDRDLGPVDLVQLSHCWTSNCNCCSFQSSYVSNAIKLYYYPITTIRYFKPRGSAIFCLLSFILPSFCLIHAYQIGHCRRPSCLRLQSSPEPNLWFFHCGIRTQNPSACPRRRFASYPPLSSNHRSLRPLIRSNVPFY